MAIIQYEAADSDNLTAVKCVLREVVQRLRAERDIVEECPEFKRRMSLAITNVEQAVMWVNVSQVHDCDV